MNKKQLRDRLADDRQAQFDKFFKQINDAVNPLMLQKTDAPIMKLVALAGNLKAHVDACAAGGNPDNLPDSLSALSAALLEAMKDGVRAQALIDIAEHALDFNHTHSRAKRGRRVPKREHSGGRG